MGEKLTAFLWICFALINIAAFIVMGVDKAFAIKGMLRIPEKTLFLLAILFGGLGATLGMYSFRHKTKHWYFAVFFPLLAILQIAVLVYFGFFA